MTEFVRNLTKGLQVGLGFFLSAILVWGGISFAAATWGALPNAGTTLSSTAWNDIVSQLNALAGAIGVSGGNVGIGVSGAPGAKLDVNGSIRANGGGGGMLMYANVPGNFGGKEAVITVANGAGGANDEIWIGPNGGAATGHIQLTASTVHINSASTCLGGSCLATWGDVFGGTYTTASTNCSAVNNPKTGGQSCPSGYSAYISGRGVCNVADASTSYTYVCIKN